ncbi:redox-sensing transcriptional repressor Rex [Acidipropionibacterium virtanenii]|uniref:Redox-sensing transcriptional repressor Rex n=1 Tax=Acidipropionibacterium virtanenii TaxID=2057246 RepID=A0A344URK5_9ACTN|nr:redox-sensing transcriptional repressor Rex [Acidipropionibacterium virtanenii]AXE37903.1 Redox-sensing transcriptional repressor Rex [Acidipropionibacterium virtanenii]
MSQPNATVLPAATVSRLPGYLRVLHEAEDSGVEVISSVALATRAGVHPALLRRDLSQLGSYGTRGVGYDVDTLIREIGRVVGDRLTWPVVIVGVGHLGQALAHHEVLRERGFELAGLVDSSPELIGSTVAGVPIRPPDELAAVVARGRAVIGVITTPAGQAQGVADALVDAGIRRILNFAAQPLEVPATVTVRGVDLTGEMQVLVYHEIHEG